MLMDERLDWLYASPDWPEPPEEPEWLDEEIAEGQCDCCEGSIMRGESALGIVLRGDNGKYRAVCLCEKCAEEKSAQEILDLIGVWNWYDDADYVCNASDDRARRLNKAETARRRRQIGRAAQMIKKGG